MVFKKGNTEWYKKKWYYTVMTPTVLEDLKVAFWMWFNDVEACLYAWIATSTFYEYCNRKPEFRKLKESLKNKPSMRAKLNLIKVINNDKSTRQLETSKRWLERKNRDEFGLKQFVDTDVKWDIKVKSPALDKLNQLLEVKASNNKSDDPDPIQTTKPKKKSKKVK